METQFRRRKVLSNTAAQYLLSSTGNVFCWIRAQRPPLDGRRKSRGLPIRLAAGPVLDPKVLEAFKVLHVRRHKRQVVHLRDRGDLTIYVRTGTPNTLLASSLSAVPGCFRLAVGEYGERLEHHLVKEGVQLRLALPVGQPIPAIDELIPDDRSNCTLATTPSQSSYNVSVWLGSNYRRQRARVEQVLQIQSVTFLPPPRSRRPSKYRDPSPVVPAGNRWRNAR